MINHLLQQLNSHVKLVLASSSPRRLEILGIIGLKPEAFPVPCCRSLFVDLLQVIISGFPEDIDKTGLTPQQYASAASFASTVAFKRGGVAGTCRALRRPRPALSTR